MKRRDFLAKGTLAAGLAASPGLLAPILENRTSSAQLTEPSEQFAKEPEEIRSADYLRRAREDQLLPKMPARTDTHLSGVKIVPMPLDERMRRGIVPRRGFCSITPGSDALLISGNGPINIDISCDPYSEQVNFRHESIFVPRKPFEAPTIARILPQVRQMMLDGKYHEAAQLAHDEWHKTPLPTGGGFGGAPAFSMHLDFPKSAAVTDYLRTVDFESTEVKVHWTDERGEWVRCTFTSRPDNLVVQWLTAPQGQSVNVRISLQRAVAPFRPTGIAAQQAAAAASSPRSGVARRPAAAPAQGEFHQDYNEQRLIFKGILDPSVNNRGYAGVTRIVREGGTATMDGTTLVIDNAASVLLLTRIEAFADFSEQQVEALHQAVDQLTPDYAVLLERARKVQSEMLNRITVDFGGAAHYAKSSEELLAEQRSSPGYSGAYLEKLFEMCRYWFILTSGKYCSMQAETNANINLQIAPGVQGNHREGMQAYFNWMESLAPDYRTNAKNIYGMRGTHYALTPTKESGVDTTLRLRRFHRGDLAPCLLALRRRMVRASRSGITIWSPATWTSCATTPCPPIKTSHCSTRTSSPSLDNNGNYIFVPSFSPENNPGNLNPGCMAVINASMDISVCREVLSNSDRSLRTAGHRGRQLSRNGRPSSQSCRLTCFKPDGSMKEWSWPTLSERYNHRHISHLYGVWPGDEIDPDRTPKLARPHSSPTVIAFRSASLPMAAAIALSSGRGSRTAIWWTPNSASSSRKATSAPPFAAPTIPTPPPCRTPRAAFPSS